MLIYFDSSALLKRVMPEAESRQFAEFVAEAAATGHSLVTSALARVEISRVLKRGTSHVDPSGGSLLHGALQGLAIAPIDGSVIEMARTAGPPHLRSLDALHLATAILVSADEAWTYDVRLAEAFRSSGIPARPNEIA